MILFFIITNVPHLKLHEIITMALLLIYIYKFNEYQGTTVYNSAQTSDGRANGLNGALTLTGNSAGTCESVTSTDTWHMGENGKFGAALALDGNDYAVVATPGLPTVDFTYAAWIYLDTINND